MRPPQYEITGAVGFWPWRVAGSALLVFSAGSLPWLAEQILRAGDPPLSAFELFRMFLAMSLLPAVAAHLLLRAATAVITLGNAELVLQTRGVTIEVPARAIARIRPWLVPLPAPGFSIQLRSGQWLRYGVCIDDPMPVLRALADEHHCDAAAAAAAHPLVAWAHARQEHGRPSLTFLLLKYVAFGLAPTMILFNAHQHISFGGFLGQWYLQGPVQWLTTLAMYWLSLVIYLLVYGGFLRGLAEVAVLLVTWMRTSAAVGARRWAERTCHLLYFGGVPLLVGLRFLDW